MPCSATQHTAFLINGTARQLPAYITQQTASCLVQPSGYAAAAGFAVDVEENKSSVRIDVAAGMFRPNFLTVRSPIASGLYASSDTSSK
jgi:hypothetical protein